MATKAEIQSDILRKIGVYPSLWRIGITRDIQNRKQYWASQGSIQGWQSWATQSLADAQDIENWGINTKGMRGGVGGNLEGHGTVFVYVFRP